MPMLKFARAAIAQSTVSGAGWAKVRTAAKASAEVSENLVDRASEIFGKPFVPSEYLLTHATIVASVDTFAPPNTKLGKVMEGGFRVNRKFGNYRVKLGCDKYINNNLDCWDREVLAKSYRTFIGAHNFVEHIQVEELSKGRIIDAVARDLGDSVYVDILIATDRKHTDLVEAIESGKMSTLSMGCTVDGTICTKCGHWAADETEMCFPTGTRVLMADGKYVPIEEVVEGDLVVTHTGAIQPVLHTMGRRHDGNVTVLNVEGVPQPIRPTTGHRFWALRPETTCQCGCGEPLRRTIEHERGAVQAFKRRFLPGHNSKVPVSDGGILLPFTTAPRETGAKLEFVPAKDIRKGDYLTFPIPQQVTQSPEATEAKARLIGFFLAEGSFIKRDGALVGVSFDFGAHEHDTLAAEVESLLNEVWGRDERRTVGFDWQTKVAADGIKTIRRRKTSRPVPSDLTCPSCEAPSEYAYNVRFKKGRDDCYQCKVCDRQWVGGADRAVKVRRNLTGKSTCTVRLMWAEAAEWFHRFCGEYAYGKVLASEVMYWPQEVQKHVLFGWLGGDGTQSRLGITGNTASFDLVSQMHVLAARCGWYSRKQVTFDRRAAILDEVVNGSGPVIVRDSNGWLPSFALTVAEPAGFDGEVRFSDPENARVTLSGITDGFKRVGNYLLYRVAETWNECFSGQVHNIEVAGDESYVVEGLAVHNCPHIKYEKGNTFFDDQGRQHRVAELCGHPSIDPTGGVQFIEGSWVGTPAFTGAVLRNILALHGGDELGKAASAMLQTPPEAWTKGQRRKAAALAFGGDHFMAGWGDEGDEGEGGDDEAPAPEKAKGGPFDDLEDELTTHLKDRVRKKLKKDMDQKDLDEALGPEEASTAPNDSIVKQSLMMDDLVPDASQRAVYGATVAFVCRTASNDADLMTKVALLNSDYGVDIPVPLYRAALRLGSTTGYGSVGQFVRACLAALGRKPTTAEAKTLIRLGKLLSSRGPARSGSQTQPGSRHSEGDMR